MRNNVRSRRSNNPPVECHRHPSRGKKRNYRQMFVLYPRRKVQVLYVVESKRKGSKNTGASRLRESGNYAGKNSEVNIGEVAIGRSWQKRVT